MNLKQVLGLASEAEIAKAGTATSTSINFFTALRNSVIIWSLITLGQVVFCSMAAYALARLKFPGRDKLFFLSLPDGDDDPVVILVTATAGRPVIWAGMLAFAGPLAVWVAYRDRALFVRSHAGAALAFNLSLALYLAGITGGLHLTAGSPYTIQFVPFPLFLNMLLAFNWFVFTVVATHRAANGQPFTYPLTLRRLGRPLSFPRRGPT